MEKKESTLRVVWFFISKNRMYFIFLIGLAMITGILESLNVALMYPIISEGLDINASTNTFLNFIDPYVKILPIDDELIRYCVVFIILASTVFVTKIVYYFLSVKFSSKIVMETKKSVFNKCINADYQFFVDHKQGEILYKTSEAPNNLAKLIQILTNIFVDLFLTISVFTVLLTMSWKGVVLVLFGGFIYLLITRYLGTVISYRSGKEKRQSSESERVIINEYTSGVKQIKVFETYSFWKDMMDNVLKNFWHHHRRNYFWSRFPDVLIWMVLYMSIGAAVIFIKLQYPGNFKSLLPLLGTFAFGVLMLLPKISRFGQYRMAFMHILPNVEAVHDLLKDERYTKIKNGDREFTGLEKSIKIDNVTFSYKDREVLLKDFTLDIKKDKITALVGSSGSGKSTIVNLLLRLYDVEEGEGVFIDDVNIKEFDIFTYLRKVGFVSQETFIYNASIRDNIDFGGSYSDEEIIEAAMLANAHEFIKKLPDGYDTKVGDRGLKISGGEKQRIAIARAMIRKPEILILDEATSSLDNISEKIVQNAINKVSQNCTTFIIAHRLSTVQNADVINVLDNGKIIESGSHDELMKKKGIYRKLYTSQNK